MSRWYARDLCWAYRMKYREEDSSWVVKQPGFEREAVQSWLIAQLASGGGLWLCSPNGVTLRCSQVIASHQDQIEMLPCPLPFEESSLLRPSECQEQPLSRKDWFLSRFRFFDHITGTIRTFENMKMHSVDVSGFSSSVQQELVERDEVLLEGVARYHGFSICAEEEVFGETEASELGAFGITRELVEAINQGTPADVRAFGDEPTPRFRVRDQAAQVYADLYPAGHEAEGVALKVATDAVSNAIGRRISDDTLRRAIGKRK